MQVDIKEGGDGVACWNAEAITAYAAATDARETALASANPDLIVTPGRVKCYGCQVNDFALGIRCTAELTRKAKDTLVPKLEKLPGFKGYFLIEAGNGVFSSLNLFETPEQGMESTKIVATWIRDEKLDTFIPNEPKITSGKVVAHSDRVLVAA